MHAYVFDKEVIAIGRLPSADIFLENPAVSRAHAQVRTEGDGHVVEDLGSSNGTLVNGVKIKKNPLRTGDQIGLGKFVLDINITVDPGNLGDPLPEVSFAQVAHMDMSRSQPQAPRVAGFSDMPEDTTVIKILPDD